MMHHPMHLHGHFFRVINQFGERSPLKHTVDVPPHGQRVIEFYADEPGQWMLHCHNLYHMKSGMARVVRYRSFQPTPEMAAWDKKDPHYMQHVYTTGMLEAATNHAQAQLKFSRIWDTLEAKFETREYNNLEHAEGDLFYSRWFSKYFKLFGGAVHSSEYNEETTRGVFGVGYVLPMMIDSHLMIDHKGEFRFDIEKKLQWTKTVYTDLEVTMRENIDPEFELTLMYANSWSWAVGLMLTEEDIGIGAQYNF